MMCEYCRTDFETVREADLHEPCPANPFISPGEDDGTPDSRPAPPRAEGPVRRLRVVAEIFVRVPAGFPHEAVSRVARQALAMSVRSVPLKWEDV